MLHVLVVLFMCFRVLFLFPTCRVRVFRFYPRCIRPPPPPSPSPHPPAPQLRVAGIIGTARLQPQAPNFSRLCRTSTVSTRSQKHCWTLTANSRFQWALPNQTRRVSGHCRTSTGSARCQIQNHIECQVEHENIRQMECQTQCEDPCKITSCNHLSSQRGVSSSNPNFAYKI